MVSQNKIYTADNAQAWREFAAARNTGNVVEVDQYIFEYFLDVLPPVLINERITYQPANPELNPVIRYVLFGHAEGAETVTMFWREKGRCFCQRSTMINPRE